MVIDIEEPVVQDRMTLEEPHEITKVMSPSASERRFKQILKYDGRRLVLRTDLIPSDKIKFCDNSYGKYLSIPVSPQLRQQLNTIEDFITTNVHIPGCLPWQARDNKDSPYKKITDGESVYITLSNWCKFFRQDPDYLHEIQPNELGDGEYQVCITVEGVYLGLHKDNKLISITMRIQQLLFKPSLPDIQIILDDILKTEGEQHNAKRRRKKKDN